jgi:hypothetical protein
MAFALGPLNRICPPDLDVLPLMRTDKQGRGRAVQALPHSWEQDDWLDGAPNLYWNALRDSWLEAVTSMPPARMSRITRRSYCYNQLADRLLTCCLRQLRGTVCEDRPAACAHPEYAARAAGLFVRQSPWRNCPVFSRVFDRSIV